MARSNFAFDPDRHGPSLRNWIVRFRKDVEEVGINLVYTLHDRGYILRNDFQVFAVSPDASGWLEKGNKTRAFGGAPGFSRVRSAREEFILSFARERDRFTVSDLC